MYENSNQLFKLVKEITRKIDSLDPLVDAPDFAAALKQTNPGLFQELTTAKNNEMLPFAAEAIAHCEIEIIKEIPRIVDGMIGAVERRTTEPAVRCALVGSLAYLVQPRDLLPDDLPGGFGFVDDCMMLRATISEFLNFLPPGFTNVDREKRLLDFLAVCIPQERIQEFQDAIQDIWRTFHSLLWLPADEVDGITEQIMQDPLGTVFPMSVDGDVPLPDGPRLSMDPGASQLSLDGEKLKITFVEHGSMTIDLGTRRIDWE
jgi:uncharacterized membrane protein YkvA (DUF1232 family)